MALDLRPVEEASAPRPALDLQPVETGTRLDLKTPEGEAPSLMDFMRQESSASETSPLTPGTLPPAPEGGMTEPLPTERQAIEGQAGATPDVRLGEQPATVGRFGKPGTLTRGASNMLGGLAEWAMNKPEEALATLTPLAPAIAARYAPEVAAQFVRQLKAGVQGDREALGEALTMAAMVGGPKAFKAMSDRAVVEGKPGVAVESPQEMALRGTMPTSEGEAMRAAAGGEKQALEVPVAHEVVLPAATETFKAVTGEKPGGVASEAAPPTTTEGATDASTISEAAALHGDVLRSGESGAPKEGVPVTEGEPGVRAQTQERVSKQEAQAVADEEPRVIAPDDPPQAPPPAESAAPGGEGAVPQLIGIKNASVDAQRAQRGEEPLMAPARKSNPELWDAAMRRIEAEPEIGDRLTRELTDRPRAITDEEVVILEHRLMELTNQLDTARWEGVKAGDAVEAASERRRAAATPEERAAAAIEVSEAEARAAHYESEAGKLSDALSAVEQASGRQSVEGGPGAGTITARGLAARRMMMREDYSYGGIERTMRQAKGFKPLNQEELGVARRTAQEWKARNEALQARLREQVDATARAEAAKELAELRAKDASAKAAITGRIRSIMSKVGAKLDERADVARPRLRGKVLSISPADLKDVADIAAANLFHIGEDLGKWTAKMIEEVGEKVRPHLEELWKGAKAAVEEAARAAREEEAAAHTGAPRGRKGVKAATPLSEAALQEAITKRIRARIAAYEERIAAGDYSSWRKPPVELGKEAQAAHYELEQVKRRFYEGLVALKMQQRTPAAKAFGGMVEGLNAMRAVLTSADLSAVLRQGLFIGLAHPLRAARSIGPMLKAFKSERAAFAVEQQIMRRSNYPLMRASHLYLAEHGTGLSKMEEAYLSRTASKLPLVGPLVKASERAYVTYLNKLRADSFDAMAGSLGKGGRVTIEQARIVSNYINVATGRGTILMADQAAAGLNAVFFAPRFVASRFQMILGQPLYYGLLSGKAPLVGKGAGQARALVAREYGQILIGASVVYGLGVAAGAEVELDSRSSDFGKLRFGNTRIDMLAGVGQVTVLLTKVATGESKNLRTGIIKPLVPPEGGKLKFGSESIGDVMARFARFKLAPAPGLAWNYLSGTDAVGNPVTVGSLAANATVPIALSDIYATMEEQGMEAGAAISVLSVFGAGVQNFDANRRR